MVYRVYDSNINNYFNDYMNYMSPQQRKEQDKIDKEKKVLFVIFVAVFVFIFSLVVITEIYWHGDDIGWQGEVEQQERVNDMIEHDNQNSEEMIRNLESKEEEHLCSLESVVCEDEEMPVIEEYTKETQEISVSEPVEQMIVDKCTEAGLADWEINKFISIAMCESRLDPNAQNKYSSAAGVMQIIKGTWQESSEYSWEDRYNAEKNIETAIKVYNRYGFSAWQCS